MTQAAQSNSTNPDAPAYSLKDIPHLAQRTLWSLRSPEPDTDAETWLLSLLTPAESLLYRSMAVTDRAHAVSCAQAVRHLGDDVAVASAMHDVGKTPAGLGTPGRVLASLVAIVMYDQARTWADATGLRGRIGRYLHHCEVGAQALTNAGSSPLAIAWALEHHLPADQQTIDPALAAALAAADG